MTGLAFFGYGTTGSDNNCSSEFSLRFATGAEGHENIGVSIPYHPLFHPENLAQTVQQDLFFEGIVAARYVEVTIHDNFFDPVYPRSGGDRVGLSEIQFHKASPNMASNPEPANGAAEVGIDVTLKWKTACISSEEAPGEIPNPEILKHKVYISSVPVGEAEMYLLAEVPAGNPVSAWAELGPIRVCRDETYFWRVDEYISDEFTLQGPLWSFTTVSGYALCPDTDLTDDCHIDLNDLLVFTDDWLSDMTSLADFIYWDGVNLTDFSLLAQDWGKAGQQLVINEFMASNDAFLRDEDGMTSDWIEIFNPSSVAISLNGWYLTDSIDRLDKWRFPDITIGPEEYLVVYASGRDRKEPDSQLHTNFVLDIEGEYLALIHPDGKTVEHAWSKVPQQYEDVSYGLAVHPGRVKSEGCYFSSPTPEEANSEPYPNTGPAIMNISLSPDRPLPHEDITIAVTISEVDAPISSVKLSWKVMFENDQSILMLDDGLHGDGEADDGVYGYIIPAGVVEAGQMLRYYIETTDTLGHKNRLPLALDDTGENQSPFYLGTVVANPSVQSQLPVMEWFTTNESASHSRTGTRACVYYQGRFYDNIFVRQRGQATNAYSQKFDFNKGDNFYINEKLDSVGEVNMNAKGADPAYIRQSLAFDTHLWCGTPSCESFLVLMQLNGEFDRVGVLIEQVDEDFLRRFDRDPEGALYKFVQRSGETEAQADPIHYPYLPHTPCFSDTNNGIEKKIRLWEDFSDLQAVVDGLMAPTELERQQFVFDNFNLPEMMNYLAARAISNDCDDTRKNFYFYRDTNGTGEWEIYPWDNDFTFGIYGDGGPYRDHPFFGDEEHLKTSTKQWNVLFDVLIKLPQTRQMYLRRLRTMMDELLQSPDTPADLLKYEFICETMAESTYPHISVSISDVKNFFPSRRNELYNKYGPTGEEALIPQPQGPQTEIVMTSTIISGNPGETLAYYYAPIDDSLGTQWIESDFDQIWPSGHTGIGYERNPGDNVNYTSLIMTDINEMMVGRTSIYIRIPFEIEDPTVYDVLILRMKYDDGFIAYLNGNLIPPRQFTGEPQWDSSASGGRSDSECVIYEDILLPASWLHHGTNVLAIQGLNYGASSSDFLILPELQGGIITNVGGEINNQMSITAIEYNPSLGNQDEEYIQITNNADMAVDISHWHLTGGVEFTFQPGTVIPANSRIFISPNVRAFRQRSTSPKGGQGHFVVGNYKGHLSNWGETIILADSNYATVSTMTYNGNPSSQQKYLRISEIMYHPASGGPYNEEEYEYIELLNIGSQALLLDGIKFTEGIVYEFSSGANLSLGAGEYILLVKNRDAFTFRYETTDVLFAPGTYTGNLANNGERLNLEDNTNSTILDFSYKDGWYSITDGSGFSLTIQDPENTDLDIWDSKTGWRPSAMVGGSPGDDDSGVLPAPGSIVINEVLAHSHAAAPDWIELYNTTDEP
ncbi:MAG: lamin tail domain-containing protein, partial [Sedimentisphaerales bacterium]|nr:lamin tail domain-containing protein [Sedimentisphaerales bacterium]